MRRYGVERLTCEVLLIGEYCIKDNLYICRGADGIQSWVPIPADQWDRIDEKDREILLVKGGFTGKNRAVFVVRA